jgi:phosphotransferase family enzyme
VTERATNLDFDPELPGLAAAFDLAAVSRRFEEQWPHSNTFGAAPSVTARKLLDTKYEPRSACVTTYELEVATGNGGRVRTIGTSELRPSGTVLRTFEQDPRLPGISEAVDEEAMGKRFMSELADLLPSVAGPPEITAVRYKPGARCVLRYTFPTSSAPRVFFGKIIVEDPGRLAQSISILQKESSRTPGMPLIAGPVAYWSDLRMLVQRAVEGSELHDVAFDATVAAADRLRWMERAGRGLAGLHSATGDGALHRDIHADADELDTYTAPMAQVNPDLAGSFARAVETVRAEAHPDKSSFVACHGAFRTDQFMIQHGDLVMIDLDSFCLSHPERDVGNFLAYLTWKAMRQPQHAEVITRAPEHFLRGYGSVGPPLDERRIRIYTAASLLKIAGRRYRSLTVREWPKVPSLIAAAQSSLAE